LSEDFEGREFVVYKGLYVMIILTAIKQFVQTVADPLAEG